LFPDFLDGSFYGENPGTKCERFASTAFIRALRLDSLEVEEYPSDAEFKGNYVNSICGVTASGTDIRYRGEQSWDDG